MVQKVLNASTTISLLCKVHLSSQQEKGKRKERGGAGKGKRKERRERGKFFQKNFSGKKIFETPPKVLSYSQSSFSFSSHSSALGKEKERKEKV